MACRLAIGGRCFARSAVFVSFRFLIFKFRPGCHAWSLVITARSVLLAVIPVCWPQHPYVQIFVLTAALLLAFGATIHFAPWLTRGLNASDVGVLALLILVLVLGTALLPSYETVEGGDEGALRLVQVVGVMVEVGNEGGGGAVVVMVEESGWECPNTTEHLA